MNSHKDQLLPLTILEFDEDYKRDKTCTKSRPGKKRKRKRKIPGELPLLPEESWLAKIEPTLQNSLLSQVHNGGEKWKLEKADSDNPRKLQATNGQKWWMAVIIGFLFFILASPSLFKASNKLFKMIRFPGSYTGGMTTLFGLFIHMLVFILIIRIILW